MDGVDLMAGKVLALEPYFGGSHKSFLLGLADIIAGGLDLLTLPAQKWKWRMRLSGPWLANELTGIGNPLDYRCLLCSTFVDVASLKGLLPEWAKGLPICTYFHENQFAYPVQVEEERDLHFAMTNVTTALASDRLAFNSAYNLETFLQGCHQLLKKCPDMRLPDLEEKIRAKSSILHPGLDFRAIDQASAPKEKKSSPVIVWNHRWEHDKNPAQFFEAMFALDRLGLDFKLVVLGESFRNQPEIFAEAEERLRHRTLKFGYAESRPDYGKWLHRGDVVISTSGHEFFGISVIEAVRAGCRPLLPNRLAYPELFPAEYLYGEGELVDRLMVALKDGGLEAGTAFGLTERFSWQKISGRYNDWLSGQ